MKTTRRAATKTTKGSPVLRTRLMLARARAAELEAAAKETKVDFKRARKAHKQAKKHAKLARKEVKALLRELKAVAPAKSKSKRVRPLRPRRATAARPVPAEIAPVNPDPALTAAGLTESAPATPAI